MRGKMNSQVHWWHGWYRGKLRPILPGTLHPWYCKPGQTLVVGSVTAFSGRSSGAVLFNGHDAPVKLPSKELWVSHGSF